MKKITLLTTILLLSIASNAQDTTKHTTQVISRNPENQPVYKIFIFEDHIAKALFNIIGVCPDDINVGYSVNQMKQIFKKAYDNQPVIPMDTAAVKPVEVKKDKKKK